MPCQERLLRQFRQVAGKSGYLCERDFKKAADIRSDFFASRLFHTIDQDGNGAITCDEFVNFMYTIECQDVRGRLQILFSMYDMDGTGGLNLAELIQLLLVSADGQPQRTLLQSFLAGAPAVFLGC